MYTKIIIGFSVILCLCSLSQCNDIINNGYVCCFLWNLIIVKNIIIKQNSWNRLLYSFIFKIGFFFRIQFYLCVFWEFLWRFFFSYSAFSFRVLRGILKCSLENGECFNKNYDFLYFMRNLK